MGFFGKLFEKKICDVCGGEIGLLGNRKLEDGNLCKECAGKLSPWFSDRRSSTVAQIKEQLAYREENKKAVEAFEVTRSFGENDWICFDDRAGKFLVSHTEEFRDQNPDVLDFSQITGCDLDIQQTETELKRTNDEGERVSYNPPRYRYNYQFYLTVRVNHPYFDDMRLHLNNLSVDVRPTTSFFGTTSLNPSSDPDYRKFEEMGRQIREALLNARDDALRSGRREEEQIPVAVPAGAEEVACPWCGSKVTPDASRCCPLCGGSVDA